MSHQTYGEDLFDFASAVMFMAFFGIFWAIVGLGGLEHASLWLVIIISLAGLILLSLGIHMNIKAKQFPKNPDPNQEARAKRRGYYFLALVIFEGVMIALAGLILNVINQFNYFFPVMGVIIGLHFLPLAALLKIKLYMAVGTALVILNGVSLIFTPTGSLINHGQFLPWMLMSGFGSATILWLAAITMWTKGKKQTTINRHD